MRILIVTITAGAGHLPAALAQARQARRLAAVGDPARQGQARGTPASPRSPRR